MEEKQSKRNKLFHLVYPALNRAGQKSIWLFSSVRVFAPKSVAEPIRKAQRFLEKLFPKTP